MKQKTRILAGILSLILLLALCACGGTQSADNAAAPISLNAKEKQFQILPIHFLPRKAILRRSSLWNRMKSDCL